MVGHSLYEVREVSVNLNEGDWHVDQICKMVNKSRGNERRPKLVSRLL